MAGAPPPPDDEWLKLPGLAPDYQPKREGRVIGIDLGTTNSCVSIVDDGKPTVIRSREGYATLPSIVALSNKGRLMVGHPAKDQWLLNPEATVYGAKRLVGRPFESPVVERVKDRMFYEIAPDDEGRTGVRLGGRALTLEEISALILNEVRQLAEVHLGEPVSRAVITCPAFYQENQRAAVRRAGRLAGLVVERVVNEPTAAAVAFGENRQFSGRVAVYDLGGGTFDASVMEIAGGEYKVRGTGGDTFLGGVDFDHALVDHLLLRFHQTHGVPLRLGPVEHQRLSSAAEQAKRELSERREHRVHLPMIMMRGEQPFDVDVTVTRDDFEALCGPLVDRTLEVFEQVFAEAGLTPADVDHVLLVGGMTRVPLVRDRLEAYFGKAPHKGVHPDECVALGAALVAGAAEGGDESITLQDVNPMSIGVGLPAGRVKTVIPKNTPVPVRKTYEVRVTQRDQRELELAIYQGENDQAAQCELLSQLKLTRLPKGDARVEVAFSLSKECILSLSAKELNTGRSVEVQVATQGTPVAVRQRIQSAQGTGSQQGLLGRLLDRLRGR